jgi:hypothetical protein
VVKVIHPGIESRIMKAISRPLLLILHIEKERKEIQEIKDGDIQVYETAVIERFK